MSQRDCWNWTGAKNKDGYGCLKRKGKTILAHRAAYADAFGDPGELCVLHHCDNPSCVRPSHLFLGTQRDNVYDCMAKKRRRNQNGELSSSAKLTDIQVLEVRQHYADGSLTPREMSHFLGVTTQTIYGIIHRKTWKHLVAA